MSFRTNVRNLNLRFLNRYAHFEMTFKTINFTPTTIYNTCHHQF